MEYKLVYFVLTKAYYPSAPSPDPLPECGNAQIPTCNLSIWVCMEIFSLASEIKHASQTDRATQGREMK